MSIGLAGYGIFLPVEVEIAQEAAERTGLPVEVLTGLGMVRRYLPDHDETPLFMGLEAAEMAFMRAYEEGPGIGPEDLDLIIWIGEGSPDMRLQSTAGLVREELSAGQALTFDLVRPGTGLIQAIRIFEALAALPDGPRVALVLGAHRLADLVSPSNTLPGPHLAWSASGGALILKRNHPASRLIGTALAELKGADRLAAVAGHSAEDFAGGRGDLILAGPEGLASFQEALTAGLIRVGRAAAGDEPIDYALLPHLDQAAQRRVLSGLGLTPEQTTPLWMTGRHGSLDPLIGLALARHGGAVRDGRRIILAGGGYQSGVGAAAFVWGEAD